MNKSYRELRRSHSRQVETTDNTQIDLFASHLNNVKRRAAQTTSLFFPADQILVNKCVMLKILILNGVNGCCTQDNENRNQVMIKTRVYQARDKTNTKAGRDWVKIKTSASSALFYMSNTHKPASIMFSVWFLSRLIETIVQYRMYQTNK